jgi:ABC-type spermidine/putrescine transport system permease subunit II
VRFGLTPAVNALATIMLTVTVLAVIVTAIVLRRSRVRATPGQDQTRGLDIAVGLR